MRQTSSSLCTVGAETYRVEPLLATYSMLKFGVNEAIDDYAIKLLPEALAAVARASSQRVLVAAPPYTAIPAAANLLSRRLVQIAPADCAGQLDLCELRKQPDTDRFPDAHYAHLDPAARAAAVASSAKRWSAGRAIAGAEIVFVNDLYATGAQERALARFFRAHGVGGIHWLYIVHIEDRDPKTHASLEPLINRLSLADDADVCQILTTRPFTPTSTMMWWLFSRPLSLFAELVTRLSSTARRMICELVEDEGLAERVESERLGLLRKRL